jgi:hypothetical protein
MCRIVDSPSAPPVLVFLSDSKDCRGLADRAMMAVNGRRACVLSIEDEDLEGFERGLAEIVSSELGRGMPETRSSAQIDELSESLNRLAASTMPITILIIGYENVSQPAVHQSMKRILDFAPDELRMVFISRGIPPIAIPRLLVRHRAEVYRVEPQS